MSTVNSLQQPLVPGDAEHAPERRRFIKQAGTGLIGLGGLIVASSAPAAEARGSAARSRPAALLRTRTTSTKALA